MSHKALSWAWSIQGLPSTQKFLLVALADFADEMHSCYPGQEKLAGMIGVQRQSVSRNLGELEKAGFISREQRRRRDGYRTSDRFVLAVDEIGSCPRIVRTPDDDLMSAKTRSHVREKGGHEPSVEPSVELPSIVSPHSGENLAAMFMAFWAEYPRKVGKRSAESSFGQAVKRVGAAHPIIAGALRFAHDPNLPDKYFIPHPATWLNRDGWEDEPLPPRGGRPGVVQAGRDADAILRARAAEQAAIEGDT